MMAIELNECEEFFSMISFAVSQWKRPCYTFYISFCFGFCVFVLLLACIFVWMMFNTSKASIAKKNVLWSFVQFRLAGSLFVGFYFFSWDFGSMMISKIIIPEWLLHRRIPLQSAVSTRKSILNSRSFQGSWIKMSFWNPGPSCSKAD